MIEAGSVKPGDLVDGKYRIDYVLGRGGFGVVLGATDLSLEREVAIKVLHPALAQDEVFKARFVREARATVQLRSEHSVRVHEVGEFAGASPYIVMERLVGRDLGVVLHDQGRLSVEAALDYILQAIEGIAEAHAVGIVHRDIKPGNLFLTQRPDKTPLIKVLDYGLAKAPTAWGARLTRDSGFFGSPAYMSPEQLKGAADVDARADIWALGVSLYELLAGVVPFAAGSGVEVGIMVLRDWPVPLRERCPGIHVGLSTVIMRCLEKEPSDRYENVAKLAAALEAYSTEMPSSVRERVGRVLNTPIVIPELPLPSLPRPHADENAATQTDVAVDTKPRRTRTRAFLAAAMGIAGLLVVGLASGALGVFARSRTPPPNKTSTAATSPESTAPATSSVSSSSRPPAGPASTPSAASITPPVRTVSAASRTTRSLPPPKKPAPGASAVDARPGRTDPAKDPVHL